jgi:hypothetical protein
MVVHNSESPPPCSLYTWIGRWVGLVQRIVYCGAISTNLSDLAIIVGYLSAVVERKRSKILTKETRKYRIGQLTRPHSHHVCNLHSMVGVCVCVSFATAKFSKSTLHWLCDLVWCLIGASCCS